MAPPLSLCAPSSPTPTGPRLNSLSPCSLHPARIHSVGSKPDGKLKGEIEIAKITAVENVPFETFGRPYMLQAVHSEAVLYIQCQTVKSRDEWVRALREQIKNHPQLNEKYHIGYYEGRWTCCSVMDRDLEGCTPAFDYR